MTSEDLEYNVQVILINVIVLLRYFLVTSCFYCMEKSRLEILFNISFCENHMGLEGDGMSK